MFKNLPSNAGNACLIPCQRTKIPHAARLLNLHTTIREACPSLQRPSATEEKKKSMLKQDNVVILSPPKEHGTI